MTRFEVFGKPCLDTGEAGIKPVVMPLIVGIILSFLGTTVIFFMDISENDLDCVLTMNSLPESVPIKIIRVPGS